MTVGLASAGSAGVASTSYASGPDATQQRLGMHDKAFATGAWDTPQRPSSHPADRKVAAGLSELGSAVNVGPLSVADKKAQQQQQATLRFVKSGAFGGVLFGGGCG